LVDLYWLSIKIYIPFHSSYLYKTRLLQLSAYFVNKSLLQILKKERYSCACPRFSDFCNLHKEDYNFMMNYLLHLRCKIVGYCIGESESWRRHGRNKIYDEVTALAIREVRRLHGRSEKYEDCINETRSAKTALTTWESWRVKCVNPVLRHWLKTIYSFEFISYVVIIRNKSQITN
jgi:hypothetical protein